MGEMRDSDWSRENMLRSDWLLPSVATITTKILKYILYMQSKDEETFVKQAFLMSFDLHCNGKK